MKDVLHPDMIEARTAALDAQDTRIAQYNVPDCYFCGSRDGMEAWSAENIRDARDDNRYPMPMLYRLRERALEEHERLFTPCCVCNTAGWVSGEYEAVGAEELEQWLQHDES
jgi:hypothetical protein